MNPAPSPLPPGEGQGEGAARPDPAQTQWFGTLIALGAWAMFFAALAFAVSYLRMREPWPTEGALALPRLLPGLGVLLLAIGSGLLHSARRRPARWRLGGAIVLGTAFLMQQALLASSLWNSGLRLPAGGAYASAFYGLMAVHALHAGVGLLGLTRVARGFEQDAHAPQRLRLWTLYWHFVTVTGWLFFAAVYLP